MFSISCNRKERPRGTILCAVIRRYKFFRTLEGAAAFLFFLYILFFFLFFSLFCRSIRILISIISAALSRWQVGQERARFRQPPPPPPSPPYLIYLIKLQTEGKGRGEETRERVNTARLIGDRYLSK